MTPAECWDLQQLVIALLCHVQTIQYLPNIWANIAPLKKEKTHTILKIVCLTQAQAL